jgi:hypothetical protein
MVILRATRLKGVFLNQSAFFPRELKLERADAERRVRYPGVFRPPAYDSFDVLPNLRLEFAVVHSHGPVLQKVSTEKNGEFDFGPIQPGTYAILEGSTVLIVVRVQPNRMETTVDGRLEFDSISWKRPAVRVRADWSYAWQ